MLINHAARIATCTVLTSLGDIPIPVLEQMMTGQEAKPLEEWGQDATGGESYVGLVGRRFVSNIVPG